MDGIMAIFSVLATPLGIAMKWLYTLLQNYGWTIIVFTILARVLMFPLSIKQQKSTARMSAYQPMIQEIQKKWANDKNKQNQEVQKFYEENNIKMTAGCAPMLVNMLVIFGMIAVIQAPLNYILQVPETAIDQGVAIVKHFDPESNIDSGSSSYTRQSILIGEIKENPQRFIEGVTATDADGKEFHAAIEAAQVEKVKEFNFEFLGLNLANAPRLNFDRYLIMPILSVLTMFASQFIVMKTSPTSGQQGGQMMIMTLLMGVMFGFYAFRVPVGFSLYYTVSNVMMLFQQLVLRKIYDPLKIREEIEVEMEARRAAKKAKKKVVVRDDEGDVVSLDVSEAELNKLRLARAREMDAKRYAEDVAEEQAAKEKANKARQMDEARYGAAGAPGKQELGHKKPDAYDNSFDETLEIIEEYEAEKAEDAAEINSVENDEKSTEKENEYKPGRRKRARQSKEETSFVEQERQNEKKDEISKEMEEK